MHWRLLGKRPHDCDCVYISGNGGRSSSCLAKERGVLSVPPPHPTPTPGRNICLPSRLLSCKEENEIFQRSISVANSITVGTCSKRCNFQEAEIENLAANETANN